jgi:uncharacterized membrane protein HdeD (DUF308 family)
MTDPTPPRPLRQAATGITVMFAILLVAVAVLLVWLGVKTRSGRGWPASRLPWS